MLYKMHKEYEDGRIEEVIHYKAPDEIVVIHPRQEGIKHAGCKPFKYEVPKHAYLPLALVTFRGQKYIYPSQTECHPQTTLNDVVEILSEEQLEQVKSTLPKKEEPKKWKFESVSGGGTYVVTQTPKGLKCDCMGYFRAKDRRCKHIKEVESY